MLMAADVAWHLNLKKLPRSWRGECPACSYPSTFVVRPGRDGRALFHCASCSDRAALDDAVRRRLGAERPAKAARPVADQAIATRKREAAARLWDCASAAAGTLVEVYLRARGVPHVARSPSVRFIASCHHPEGGTYPAMTAAIRNAAGDLIAVHRTYLAANGQGKADTEPQKASLGPAWGGAIRLAEPAADRPLVIGEGIETAAAAGLLMDAPAWAAISAGNLGKGLLLPLQVRNVIIAADPDQAGETAAREAALRWSAEGRQVKIARPRGAGDFADLLIDRIST